MFYNLNLSDNYNNNLSTNPAAANLADGKANGSPSSPPAVPPGQYLRPDALERLLNRCASTAADGADLDSASLYLPPAALVQLPQSRDPRLKQWRQFLSPAIQGPGGDALLKSDTGLAALRCGERGLAIIPPFPITTDFATFNTTFNAISDAVGDAVNAPLADGLRPCWDADPLSQLLTTDYTVGVVLLRLGRYLVAVFHGERPLITKTDTRYVKGKHHAGGTSQLRFRRIREGQIRKLYDETCQVVSQRFAPHAAELDYILLGGDRITLNGFIQVCPYLRQCQAQGLTLNRRLNIRDPKRDTLETVAGMLRQSRVWTIGW